ncbi:MAG: peptide ABC transporter substrate-binding protein [Alphaproteobacteria bacterium]
METPTAAKSGRPCNQTRTASCDAIAGVLRRSLLWAALAIGLGASVTACDGGAPSKGSAPVREEIVLHRGNSGEPSSLDPHRISGIWESNIGRDLYLGLFTDAADGTPIPGAAESYSVSDDGLTYTFTMRDGHTWSDGVPVTADDFVFAFRRILDPATAAEYASLLYVLKNAAAINAGEAPLESLGARAEDPGTLVLTLDYPAPFLPQLLTHQAAYPVPRHVIEDQGDDWVKAGTMVTNGAYVLGEWLPNDHVRLEKNPRFYDAENVAIDRVFFYPTDDRASAVRRFRAGELDLNNDFPIQQLEFLRRTRPDAVRLAPFLLSNCIFVNTQVAPFDRVGVRRALSMAIDRDVLARDIMRSGQTPSYAFVPPEIVNYPHTAALSFRDQSMEDRIAKARSLMAEAGYGPDNPLRVTLRHREGQDHRNVAIAIGAMWKQIHVEAELLNTELKTHYADLRTGNFVLADGGWVADFNDAKNYLFLLETKTGYLNYTNYSNPAYDALVEQADGTGDIAERGRLLAEAEQLMLADSPVLPTFVDTSRNLVGEHVLGFVDNPDNKHPSRFLSIDETRRQR